MKEIANSEEDEARSESRRFSHILAARCRSIWRIMRSASTAIGDAEPNKVIAFFTVVMAIATVIIAITTSLQWTIMREQTAQTDAIIEQMRLEKRAWLSVHRPKVLKLEENELHRFSITISNTGNIPGTAVTLGTYTFNARVGEDIKSRFTELIHREHRSVFAPDSIYTIPIQGDQPLTHDLIAAITSPDKTHELYLIGVLTYDDGLGEIRRTEFCFRYEDEPKELRACHLHNYME